MTPTIELKENRVFFRLLEKNKKNSQLKIVSKAVGLEYDVYPKEKLNNSTIDSILRKVMGDANKGEEGGGAIAGRGGGRDMEEGERERGGSKAKGDGMTGGVGEGGGVMKGGRAGGLLNKIKIDTKRTSLHFTILDDFLILKRLSSFQNADGSFSFKSINLKQLCKTLGKSSEEIENRFCSHLKTLRNKDLLKIEQFVEKGENGVLVFEDGEMKQIRREEGKKGRRRGMGFLMEAVSG